MQGTELWKQLRDWMNDDVLRLSELLSRHAELEGTPNPNAGSVQDIRALKHIKRLARGVTWLASNRDRLRELADRIRQWNDRLAALLHRVQTTED
jgi:hypothetical protein